MKILNRDGPFVCDRCGRNYVNRENFRNHFFKLHRKRVNTVLHYCDICPQFFELKCFLANHMKRDHLKIRSHECKICGYKAFSRNEIKQHMLRHVSKSKCKICHRFVTNLYQHSRAHIKIDCRVCGKSYSKTTLRNHMKSHRKTKQLMVKF